MTFIKKIFEDKIDDSVHRNFIRFSKGTFYNRALTKLKVSKNKCNIYASFDLANSLVKIFSSMISTAKISGRLIKKGKKSEIDEEVTSDQLNKIIDENDYCLIDISINEYLLKCKKSLPKPGKALDPKFCSATLPVDKIKDLIFDINENFKQAQISHIFVINELSIPKEYEKDPEKARIFAKRKGRIIRKIILDGKEITREKELIV